MGQSDSGERRYRVLIGSFVAEGREYHRGDLLVASDVPGEISDLLHAGIVAPAKVDEPPEEPSGR